MSFTSGQILTASQLNTFAPGTRITNADGSTSAPAYSFSTDDNTGFYVTGNEGRIRFVGDGTPGGWLSNTGIRTIDGSASVPSYSFTSDSNTGMFRSGTDTIGLATGGTQVVTISSDGRLGVGDTSPSATLHVNAATANTTAVFESTDAEAYIGLKDNSSGSDLHVAVAAISNDLVLRAGNSNAVRVKDDGDVGIGTTSPDARLHVNSGTTNLTSVFESTDATALIGIKDNSSSSDTHVAVGAVGDEMRLRAGDANRVSITGTEMIPNVDLRPSADGTIELGTSTYRWQAVHSDRYYLADSDSYIQFDADSGAGIDGPGFRFVINGSEMFKFQRENNDSNHSMLSFGENNDGILYEKDTEQFNFYINGTNVARIVTAGDLIVAAGATFRGDDSGSQFPTGSGTDARIVTGFGLSALAKFSSVLADKENISTDLGTHLTADMIDSVVPKMWNRIEAPGYPEIGPIAEDMDAITPFLSSAGTDADGEHLLMGINTVGWLSLLTLAVKDLRTRVAALESA